jgi:hypothetical protein
MVRRNLSCAAVDVCDFVNANGEDVKVVVQQLLRHGSVRIGMDVYAQAMTPAVGRHFRVRTDQLPESSGLSVAAPMMASVFGMVAFQVSGF